MNEAVAVEYAARALACLDLTSLNDDDTPERIDALCGRALRPRQRDERRPAAVCVYPRFAAQAASRLAGSGVKVAVVVNFPGGDSSTGVTVAETVRALDDGADEIDVVFPHAAYAAGRRDEACELVRQVRRACDQHGRPALLKVILETGALGERSLIAAAARDAVEAGAMFLKTSTGKREPGATPAAVEALLDVIVESRGVGRDIGLKVSGGVRTVTDAGVYLDMADRRLAPDRARPSNFRFGASGLLDDIVRVLTGAASAAVANEGY